MTDAYTAGFLSGIVQTLVGHPLDTIKVRLQSHRPLGVRSLYAGVTYPLLSSGIINSISFGVADATISYGYLGSGIIAGVVSGFVSAPIEYLKVQRQSNHVNAIKWRDIIVSGQLAMGTTLLRDAIGYGVYFPVFYHCKEEVGTFKAGAIAGIASWTAIYPLDTIKTRIQSGSTVKSSLLWKGYLPCIIRAGLVNAVGWVVYETLMSK